MVGDNNGAAPVRDGDSVHVMRHDAAPIAQPLFEVFGCWIPEHFCSVKGIGPIVYAITARCFCPESHALQRLITLVDMRLLGAIPWDSLYNEIHNSFVEAHRR